MMDRLLGQPLTLDSSQRLPLRIKVMGQRGRGVVAAAHIRKGDLVERCPVLIIPATDWAATDATVIFSYVFVWEPNTVEEDLYRHRGRSAIALGYKSLLNHSYTPNCEFVRHVDDLVIDLIALQDIEAGEVPKDVEHRTSRYLNNIIEADRGALKRVIRPTRGFKRMKTAYATIKDFEVMRMICRGHCMLPESGATGEIRL